MVSELLSTIAKLRGLSWGQVLKAAASRCQPYQEPHHADRACKASICLASGVVFPRFLLAVYRRYSHSSIAKY